MYQGTSELFNEKIKASSRTFRAKLVNTSDSTDVIEKGFRKLTIAQISNEDKRSLSIGGITASELNVEIDNLSGVITGKEFDVQIGLLLDDEQNTYEWVTIGKFTAQKPTIKNNVTSFTAFDRFVSKLGGLYVSRLTYPASGKAILNEIATMSGVVINTDGLTDIMFPQKTVINSSGENVSANPFDGFTYREAISYVAMAYGKFATVNRNGQVDLRWYTDTNYRIEKNMSYDDISVADTEYSVEYLNVTVNNDRNNPLIKGEGLTGISVGTPIFTTEMLNHAYGQVSGFKYIPTTLSFKGDPRIDLGDIVTVVKYDNTEVKVPVMSLDFDFDGGLICNIGSYGDTEQSEKAYATSPNANKYDRMYTDLLLLNQAIANKVTAEYVEAHYVATSKLDAVQANITQAVIKDLNTEFITAKQADLKYANIELTNIDVANVGRLLADAGLITNMVIKDGHVTGVLDSVTINANNITSGTLTTDRLVIRGTDKSIVYELNNISGALQAKKVDTLNGEIVTPRTINADRIIANSITSGELNADEIFANSAIIKKIFSEDVKATGTITGATLKGAYAEITSGNIGGWYISSNSLYTTKNIDADTRLAFLQVPDSLSSWVFSVQSEDSYGNRKGLWYVTANGDQTMKGSLTVGSNVSVGGLLSAPNISGDTTISGNLSVIKDVTVGGYLSANNGLAVYNNGSQAITISNPDSEDLVGMYFFNKLGYLGNIYMETVGGGLYRDGHLILDDTNYSNYALPLTGGTVTGNVIVEKLVMAKQGMYTADAGLVEWGRSGYVVLARMEVYDGWVENSEFEFEIKGRQGGGKILFRLNDAEALENVGVANFTADYMLPDAWFTLTRGSETITIDLIIRKEPYEDYRIVNLITTKLVFQKIRFSFPGTYESTLRDGATKAGNRTTYMANGIASNLIASIGDVIAGYGTDNQLSLKSIWSTLSGLANSHKFALYVLTDIDNLQQGIGMNIIDSSLYIAFFYSWIGLEFRVGSTDIRIRKRYGSSGWSDWKTWMGF